MIGLVFGGFQVRGIIQVPRYHIPKTATVNARGNVEPEISSSNFDNTPLPYSGYFFLIFFLQPEQARPDRSHHLSDRE